MKYTFNGKTLSLRQWSKLLGTSVQTLKYRIKAGWPIEQALSIPPHGLKCKDRALKSEDVKRIRKLYRTKEYTYKMLAEKYGVSIPTIARVITATFAYKD